MADLPAKMQTILDREHLREQEFTTDQVAQLWEKAVTSAKDAELRGLSVEGALRAAYEAGHTAVLALLSAHGLRTASGRGHHEAAFAAAAALGYEGLERTTRRMQSPHELGSATTLSSYTSRTRRRIAAGLFMSRST